MTVLLKHPDERVSYAIDVEDIGLDIASGQGASIPTGLTVHGVTPNNATSPRQVLLEVSGGVHGVIYAVKLTLTLASTTTPLVRDVAIRCLA